jgi:hypothetical protein
MPDPSTLRDSTQIILPPAALEGIREDLDEQFTLTFFEVEATTDGANEDEAEDASEVENGEKNETTDGDGASPEVSYVRIIGSPVEIKAASDFLSRHGVSLR